MTYGPLLLTALVAVGGVMIALVVAMTVCRAGRRVTTRRRARLEARLRPRILAVLAEDLDAEHAEHALPVAARSAERMLVEVVTGLLGKLRGEDRKVLIGLLERRGLLLRARRRTYRAGGLGRSRAAALLGTAGDRRALPELARLLADADPQVRAVAARSLGKLADPGAVPFLLATIDGHRPVPTSLVSMALLHIGPKAGDALQVGLGEPSGNARSVALELLGIFGIATAADDIARVLQEDMDPAVRASAARALGRIGAPRSRTVLADALAGDASDEVRADAAVGLGRVGHPDDVPVLAGALATQHTRVIRSSCEALARLGATGMQALAAAEGLAAPYAREVLAGRVQQPER